MAVNDGLLIFSDPRMSAATQTRVRAAFFGCAVILALQALWLTVPEISRVKPLAPSRQAAGADFSAAREAAARRAAQWGFVRGDLWSEIALSYGDLVSTPEPMDAQSPAGEALQRARGIAERALKQSPHDSRVWLFLAALEL